MQIAIVGPGAIGSTLAWHLVRAGHDVTVVARGARLDWLLQQGAIVRADGARAEVKVRAELDRHVEWDLVFVTVLSPQVGVLLPTLAGSRARRIMFMFNTFEPLNTLRDAVGAERFRFGFPGGIFALLLEGRIHPQVRRGTTVDDEAVARLLSAARIPTTVELDMHSWLRSHAALVAPLMALGVRAQEFNRGATWAESTLHARAFRSGFELVRSLGHPVRPALVALLSRLPLPWVTILFWLFSRTKMLSDLGRLGSAEPRMLIDMMHTAAPERSASLLAIRP